MILLDTNAIREIVTNSNMSGKGYLTRFHLYNNNYAPCFSIYNVIELKPYEDIYEKFLEFFSLIPCLMFYPYKEVILNEYNAYISNKELAITNSLAKAMI